MARFTALLGFWAICATIGCVNSRQEGANYETAIVVGAKHQAEIRPEELAWLEKHLPSARPAKIQPYWEKKKDMNYFNNAIVTRGDKIYDMLIVQLPNGTERIIYFDITGCFGK